VGNRKLLKKNKYRIYFVFLLIFVFTIFKFSDAFSITPQWYPLSPIQPTVYDQGQPNWCGPGALQSVIQWSGQYNDGTPTPAPTMITKAVLWQFMRDNTCKDIGTGRDVALVGPVGDGENDVRRLNIAYDFGVDPHALAWTMWRKTGPNHFYHYWIYYNSAEEATRSLLFTLEKYHEPVLVAVNHGAHWVLVTGYQADGPATENLGTVYAIRGWDPFGPVEFNYPYSEWISSHFTAYTYYQDPDPSTGGYVPPPDHWKNHWVTIERDLRSDLNADWGLSLSTGVVYPIFRVRIPLVVR